MGWKKDRAILETGEKQILKTLPEGKYFVIPRKFTKSEFEKLEEIQKRMNYGDDKNPVLDLVFDEFAGFMLAKGIKEHNLTSDEGEKVDFTDVSVQKDLIEHLEVATEIITCVKDFNIPLAKKSGEKSQMLPNGSSEEKDSPLEKTSLTEQTQSL